MERPLFIPVILGTARQGRRSEHAARLVFEQTKKRTDIETELIDACKVPMKLDDAGEHERPKILSDHPALRRTHYSNSGIQSWLSGLLKHALDMNLEEYNHKAVGICGVSAGPFDGTRVIQGLLPVMCELGLVAIFWDVNFENVQNLFDEHGNLLDQSYVRRLDKFLNELVWMSRVLRYGRENIAGVVE